jgi:hypothetical protein
MGSLDQTTLNKRISCKCSFQLRHFTDSAVKYFDCNVVVCDMKHYFGLFKRYCI